MDSDTTDPVDLYYHQNSIGSVVAVSDATGAVKESYRYEAFGTATTFNAVGTQVSGTAVKQPFMFTGARNDFEEASGLHQLRHRFYDSFLGRFVSRDPLGIWGDPTQGGSGQSYCGNNPVSRTDPFGLQENEATEFRIVPNRMFAIIRIGPLKEVFSNVAKNKRDQMANLAGRVEVDPDVKAGLALTADLARRIAEQPGAFIFAPPERKLPYLSVDKDFPACSGAFRVDHNGVPSINLNPGSIVALDVFKSAEEIGANDHVLAAMLSSKWFYTLLHEVRHYLQFVLGHTGLFYVPPIFLKSIDTLGEADAYFRTMLYAYLVGDPLPYPDLEASFRTSIELSVADGKLTADEVAAASHRFADKEYRNISKKTKAARGE